MKEFTIRLVLRDGPESALQLRHALVVGPHHEREWVPATEFAWPGGDTVPRKYEPWTVVTPKGKP